MLIFLDIDGVMVPAASWKTPENMEDGFPMFTKKATDALRSIVTSDTTIILSTSHRSRFTISEWKRIFANRELNIENLKSLEPNRTFKKRKDEILEWLNSHNVSDGFIIIDDDRGLNALPAELKNHLILTSPLVGLIPEQVNELKQRLHFA